MQSHCDFSGEMVKRFSIAERDCQLRGKENCSPLSLEQNKKSLQSTLPKVPQRSKLPVLSKTREPPDFHKLHQTWQSHFQKGKAACKKSCTRPQPFNFSQKGERFRAQSVTDAGICGTSPSGHTPCDPPASLKTRDPFAEVILGQNKKESCEEKGGTEVDFKADPAALTSILSNIGVPTASAGKVSLAQRVPMRAMSVSHPHNRNVMVRNSMYTLPSNHTLPTNLDRMSCFSKMTIKANDQEPLFRHQMFKMPILDSAVKEAPDSKKDKLHPQENPLLQQMNLLPAPKELCVEEPKPCPVFADNEGSAVISTALCAVSPAELDGCVAKNDSPNKPDTVFGDFVADSHALASILSNTEMSIANCGKLSLAQRVPMQGRSSFLKDPMGLSGRSVKHSGTPNPIHGPMSNVPVPLKDFVFSPCVPNTPISSDNGSGSARRVVKLKPSTMKFSQPYSLTSKQPIFPKTPRALALEKANKRHATECTELQTSSKSIVKWNDELSPFSASEVLCEKEPDIEQIAVRLFLDGECPGESGKKKHNLIGAAQQQELIRTENCINDASKHAEVSSSLQLHNNIHHAPSLQSPTEPSCSIASTVPLSFLSHPAVKALQSFTLGPCSLPDITRLRLQAAVSAKQRFWEARLDEECSFYTSRGATGSCRSCRDPVSSYLERLEDMHFTPICLGASSVELSIKKSSSHLCSPENKQLESSSATVQLDCP